MPPNGTRPATRDQGLSTDAFFEDERVPAHMTPGPAINPSTGVPFNLYDAPIKIDYWVTHRTRLLNPLQDASIAVQPEDHPQEDGGYSVSASAGMTIFGTATTERPVTLFCGPGAELNRHGLRAAFDDDGKSVLVTIPGKEQGNLFGYGVTQAQLVALFKAAGIIGTPRVKVIAGFSTGYRGCNGIINNSKSTQATPPKGTPTGSQPGTGLDLTGVTRVIYFDAFYRADQPKPGFNTNRALTAIHAETGGTCEVVIYDVTTGGTPSPLAAVVPQGMPTRHIKIKNSLAHYNALILARVVDMAIKDGFTDDAEVKKFGGQAVLDVIAAGLPKRRTVASQAGTGKGTTDVTSWTTATLAAAASAKGQVLTEKLISPQQLMGWPCTDRAGNPSFAEMQHDAHLFEFGWEYLVP